MPFVVGDLFNTKCKRIAKKLPNTDTVIPQLHPYSNKYKIKDLLTVVKRYMQYLTNVDICKLPRLSVIL